MKLIGVVDSKIQGHENDQISSDAGNCQLPLNMRKIRYKKICIAHFLSFATYKKEK